VGPGAGVGDPRGGVARRGDDDGLARVRRVNECVPQVVGGNAPRVRREIDERVDQCPTDALLGEVTDEPVGVDAVGGTEIGYPEHRLARKLPRGGQDGRVGSLEGGAL